MEDIANNITDIFVSLYYNEIDINNNNVNHNKLFYILNPEWVTQLKKNLHYNEIKKKIENYKSNEKNLKKDKNFKEKIKNIIAQDNQIKFPEELKDENFINPSLQKNEKNKHYCAYYYLECKIIQNSYFNPIYNLINRKNNYHLHNVILCKNNLIIQINNNNYEFFEKDKNLLFIPNFLVIFYKKDDFYDKFLYYKTLENYFEKEDIQAQNNNNNNNEIILLKKSKKIGKIINLSNGFKFNNNNINKYKISYDINQKKTYRKIEKR